MGTNHADSEALTLNDTNIIKSIWGGFSWSRRPVIVNVNGSHLEDYVALAQRTDALKKIPAIELNISCPNVAHGVDFGADSGMIYGLFPERHQCGIKELKKISKQSAEN